MEFLGSLDRGSLTRFLIKHLKIVENQHFDKKKIACGANTRWLEEIISPYIFYPGENPKTKNPYILRRTFRTRTRLFKTNPYPFRTRTKNPETHPYPHPYPYQVFKKLPYPSCLRTKKPFFFLTRSFYAPVLGYGCVEVDGFRLRTPGPAVETQNLK